MCNVFMIERSGYYVWLKKVPSNRSIANKLLDKNIISIFNHNKRRYGAPRITKELHAAGQLCGKNRVAKRMQKLGLKAKGKKKYKHTTDSNHHLPVASNLLNRDFIAAMPNQKWCGDISYIWTEEGWIYLATVIDIYSRKVIGWSVQSTMSQQLVCDALTMAVWRRDFPKDVLFHSDRGSQYCSNRFQRLLKNYGLICSMSRRGNCWDNSVAESFFRSLKVELIQGEKYLTREIAKENIFHYIEVYYNRIRLHSSLGFLSPENYEVQYKKVV